MDFPRIFIPRDLSLFSDLCQLGADLIALHLLEADYEHASWNDDEESRACPFEALLSTFSDMGGCEVARGHPKYDEDAGRVRINVGSYFDGVPLDVWRFHVGGYQVCEKWLKDRQAKGGKNPRPGRVLTEEDIDHYQRILVALNETIRLMEEIDEVIEEHGGWPGAFQTGGPK